MSWVLMSTLVQVRDVLDDFLNRSTINDIFFKFKYRAFCIKRFLEEESVRCFF